MLGSQNIWRWIGMNKTLFINPSLSQESPSRG
jgi:hypothetical protein